MCKTQLLFIPISYLNFGEKDSVTSCATSNSPTPNRRSGQTLMLGFETIRSLSTCIKLFTNTLLIFFGVCKKSDNCDPTKKINLEEEISTWFRPMIVQHLTSPSFDYLLMFLVAPLKTVMGSKLVLIRQVVKKMN